MKKQTIVALLALTWLPMGAQTEKEDSWAKQLSERIEVHGFIQAGYTATNEERETVRTNTFDMKRSLLFAKARITDRWSFLFMTDFNSQVQEYYTDYRVSQGKGLTVRFGQFKNQLSMENPIAPTVLELVDLCSMATSYLAGGGSDPLFGLQYGRDLGIELYGELAKGHLRYNLQVLNGNGINKKDLDNRKDVIAKLDYRPCKNFRLVASAQKGYATAKALSSYDLQVFEEMLVPGKSYEFDGIGNHYTILKGETYRRDRWTIGAEYKRPNDYWKNRGLSLRTEWMSGQDKDNIAQGGYLTGSGPIVGQLDWVASFDYFNYDVSSYYRDGNDIVKEFHKEQFKYVLGLQYWFYRNCRISAQYSLRQPWYYTTMDQYFQMQMQVAF